MLNTLLRLLGGSAPVLRRYLLMTVLYGVFSGLTISVLVPIMLHLLTGDLRDAAAWLALLAAGMTLCWVWRRQVEQTGIALAVAVLQGGRQRLGAHVAQLPLGWFSADNTARLAHVITQGTMAVAQLPAHVFTPLISGSVMPLVLVLVLLALHGPLGLVALLALPALVVMLLLSARLGRSADQTFHQNFAEASQRMLEFAQAQSVLRAFNGAGGGTRLLEQSLARQQRSGMGLIVRAALSALLSSWAVQATFSALLIVAGLWLGSQAGAQPQDALALIVALVVACRFIDPLQDLASHVEILREAQGQLKEIERILAATPLAQPTSPQMPVDGAIELREVTLRYHDDGPDVLHEVDLHIPAGTMTAIIGPSGSGKTSLMRLIARFFDTTQGSVWIGGVDVRQIARVNLTETVSQVLQDTWLFQGSIAANIRIGKPEASDVDILQAAHMAGLTPLIECLPQGLDTPVGEGGARLSGGERQRVSIARALIRQTPVLLVDEATAALDAENQALIAQTLHNLRGRCTQVIIAHQLSTVAMADHIVVLEAGQVVEQGSPAELRARDGRYAQFLDQRRAADGWRIATPRVEHD
ncbi:ABC transporter ATP-binding protein [Pseudomonas sp. RC2C2]|uniref:ABC transporter ATP-binding protein n=1 Tax=Pseudomonas sp. RC2C2 TaxID=2834408 RepID=UPI001BCFBB33|nr:ABC transporter ATP-binding protein [Pseudomonas sp. RC2C2]MBS7600886.1 ABC transporter ATP-binding protein [Pseudomonas sp. RC2C2]